MPPAGRFLVQDVSQIEAKLPNLCDSGFAIVAIDCV